MKILKELFNFKKQPLKIGDKYQGGIIAYFFQKGDDGFVTAELHGIIAAPDDQSYGIMWNKKEYTEIPKSGTKIGTGLINTMAIVESQGPGEYAAKLCFDLTIGGHNDWHLPSKDELNKLFINRLLIGGFSNKYYWCSSHHGHNTAQNQHFEDGSKGNNYRHCALCVRAVRYF